MLPKILILVICLTGTLFSVVYSDDTKCADGDKFYQDVEDCSKFYRCEDGKVSANFECSEDSYFSEETQVCDWAKNVICKNGKNPHPEDENIEGYETEETTEEEEVWTEEASTGEVSLPSISEGTETTIPVTNETEEATIESPYPVSGNEIEPAGYRYKIICYYTNWAWYRPGDGKYSPDNIPADLCTHINYAFAVLDYSTLQLKIHDSWADIDNKFYERVVALKKKNKSLKVLLALGGWNDSAGGKYSRLVRSSVARHRFIKHAVKLLKNFGFDGLDLDWEYPKCWQTDCDHGYDDDLKNFAEFVAELRSAFDMQVPKLLLSAAVSPSARIIDAGYDVPSIATNLDYINLMSYDYHGSWEKKAQHHSPIYANPSSPDPNDSIFNVDYSVNYWIAKGMPAEKINVGIPFYGRSFTLGKNEWKVLRDSANQPANYIGAPTIGGGKAGKYSRESGYLAYYEICNYIKQQGWTKQVNKYSGPFAYKDTQWVGYDDFAHIIEKAQYIKSHNLGGAMVWAIDLDDFHGKCCGVVNPLLKTLNSELRNDYPFDTNISCP